MKRLPLFLVVSALASAACADTFFDTIFTSAAQTTSKTFGATGSLPRSTMGGIFGIDSGAYTLSSVGFVVYNLGTTALTTQTVSLKIYDALNINAINGGTTASAFQGNLILNSTATFNFSGTGLASGAPALTTITGITGVTIDSLHDYGFVLSSGTNNVSFGISYGAPTYVGDDYGFNGYFRDASGDGIIQGSEARSLSGQTNQNLGLKLDGVQAVPEPATWAVLGLGFAALLRRRKRS